VVWTLQPAGVKFDPPIQVQLPNTDGYQPGQVVEVFQFDHDLEQFVSVGPARVSADGSVLVTDPGFGTTKAGWGAPQPPPPPPNTDVGSCTPAGGGPSGAGFAAGGSGPFSFAGASGTADMCTISGPQNGQCTDVPVTVNVPTPQIGGASAASANRLVDQDVPVYFSASPGGNCSSVTVDWNFGDGASGSGTSVTHTYTLPGRYTVVVNVSCASCSSATASASFEVVVKPAVIITRVISDQIPGALANFIPGGSGHDNLPYILVGARADNVLYLVAELSPISAAGGLQLAAAIRMQGETQVQCQPFSGSATGIPLQRALSVPGINGNGDVLSIDTANVVEDYEVVVGVDADNNGLLDTGEVIAVRPGIKAVSQAVYDTARQSLVLQSLIGPLFPQAYQLLTTFLGAAAPSDPPYVTRTTETITRNRKLLSHNTGLEWNASGTAEIERYTWRSDSPFASGVREDPIVRRGIRKYIEEARVGGAISDRMIQYFIDNPTVNDHVFDPFSFTSDDALGLVYDNPFRMNNVLALGGAQFVGSIQLKAVRLFVPTGVGTGFTTVFVSEITFVGHVEDLYDFEYNTNTRAAIVQAGSPTLGGAGRIFWTDIDITGTSVPPPTISDMVDLCRLPDGTYKPICTGLQP
jgi:PKD repeat protein